MLLAILAVPVVSRRLRAFLNFRGFSFAKEEYGLLH
jgi:hypothetical protein